MKNTDFDKAVRDALHEFAAGAEIRKYPVRVKLQQEMEKYPMKRRKTVKTGLAIAMAAVLLIAALAFTPPGIALAQTVRERFFPPKNTQIQLEGQDESVTLNPGAVEPDPEKNLAGYVIYVDETTFQRETKDGVERIWPRNPDAKASFEISQIAGEDYRTLLDKETAQLDQSFSVLRTGALSAPDYKVTGISVTLADGNQWNSNKINLYAIDNGKGGAFLIRSSYIFEASEGFGARFEYMLRTFELIEE